MLSVVGSESIWTVADRRLTDKGRIVREDARKIAFLEATDGVAILAYAGLGATASGTEPADWMGAVLRGRNWPIEHSLSALAEALKRELPPHLAGLRVQHGPSHTVSIPAFVNEEPRMYSIDVALSADRQRTAFRYTRWNSSKEPNKQRPPRFGMAGSGAAILAGDRSWQRPLLRLVTAYDLQRITSQTVADALAAINQRVALSLTDGTVGANCIVAWRNRKGGVYKGGGGHQAYAGTARQPMASLPTIANGMDLQALAQTTTPHVLKLFHAVFEGDANAELDEAAVNAALSKLPDEPDEQLK